jgi:hypothetical protein
MMNKVFLSLMVFLFASPAFGTSDAPLADDVSSWLTSSVTQDTTCESHALTGSEACIGATKGCGIKEMYARNYTDEYALQMMVAVNINVRGAYFCPIQVEAKNKNKGKSWTEYAMIGATSGCRWLCADGYSGSECAVEPNSGTTCDTSPFVRNNYDDLKRVTSGANIEDNIVKISSDKEKKCEGQNTTQEHNIILAITRWAPGGHGAWVRPLAVRAQREGYKDMVSWPVLSPVTGTKEILLCVDGYKPNDTGTDCGPINAAICPEVPSMCPGWTEIDEGLHMVVQSSGKNCFEFRCKGENQAFASTTDRSCIECPTNSRGGMSSVDGTCVKCEAGKVFNNKATSTATHCGEAIAYTKSDMQYGKGKTKNNNPDVAQQCWTMTETDAYRECVTGIQKKPNVVKLPTTLNPKKVLLNGAVDTTQLNLTKKN